MRAWPFLLKSVVVGLGMGGILVANPGVLEESAKPIESPKIIIIKSQRRLEFYLGDRLEKSFSVGLGYEPVKKKVRQGDGATPEGEYRICVKNPESRYFLSLGLDYPNENDADRAVKSGLISSPVRDLIDQSISKGHCPPWNTALGGEIYIHGHGASEDWTLGCIALNDDDIEYLFHRVSPGTPVQILP